MGKKRHKFRKTKENVDQSDSSDESRAATACPGKRCSHITKAINCAAMRKSFSKQKFAECTDCSKVMANSKKGDNQNIIFAEMSDNTGEEGACMENDAGIWVCLQCGHQGCDRNSNNKHALKHFTTPHSSCHALVIHLTSWLVWCYSCDEEIVPDKCKRVRECLDFLRRQDGEIISPPGIRDGLVSSSGGGSENNSTTTGHGVTNNRPKVKGLSNLGNTCFFNAVMQNLSKTPHLDVMMSEQTKKGHVMSLPGHSACGQSQIRDDDHGANDKPRNLPSLEVSLTDAGPLTNSVLTFLRDMNTTNKNSTVNPNYLFSQVCKKAPRFKGFQQQDSHELLRYLLDNIKTEEIKRVQTGILKSFKLPANVNPKKVDSDVKFKVKEYGRQGKHTMIDSVFGGVLLSTIICDECQQLSSVFEPFLDLSLSITEEKPARPSVITVNKKDSGDPVKGHTSEKPNKQQQKKLKKQARREKKLSKNRVSPLKVAGTEEEERSGQGEEERSGQGEEEEEEMRSERDDTSDADVEDNLESDASRTRMLTQTPDTDIADAASQSCTGDDKSSTLISVCGSSIGEASEMVGSDVDVTCGGGTTQSLESALANVLLCDETSVTSVKDEESPGLIRNEVSDSGAAVNGYSYKNMTSGVVGLLDSVISKFTGRGDKGCSNVESRQNCERTSYCNAIEISPKSCDVKKCNCEMPKTEMCNTRNVNERADICLGGCNGQIDTSSSRTSHSGTQPSCDTVQNNPQHGEVIMSHEGRSINGFDGITTCEVNAGLLNHCSQCDAYNINNSGIKSSVNRNMTNLTFSRTNEHCRIRTSSECVQEVKRRALATLTPRYQPAPLECSVLSCLNQFTSAELLTGNNKFGCSKCARLKTGKNSGGKGGSVYSNASKHYLIFSPPAVLTLHFKRFEQVGFTSRKVNRHVDFDFILNLSPFCSALSPVVKNAQQKVIYSLYGVIEHSGRLTGGHYTAYIKVRPNQKHKDLKFLNTYLDMLDDYFSRMVNVQNEKCPKDASLRPNQHTEDKIRPDQYTDVTTKPEQHTEDKMKQDQLTDRVMGPDDHTEDRLRPDEHTDSVLKPDDHTENRIRPDQHTDHVMRPEQHTDGCVRLHQCIDDGVRPSQHTDCSSRPDNTKVCLTSKQDTNGQDQLANACASPNKDTVDCVEEKQFEDGPSRPNQNIVDALKLNQCKYDCFNSNEHVDHVDSSNKVCDHSPSPSSQCDLCMVSNTDANKTSESNHNVALNTDQIGTHVDTPNRLSKLTETIGDSHNPLLPQCAAADDAIKHSDASNPLKNTPNSITIKVASLCGNDSSSSSTQLTGDIRDCNISPDDSSTGNTNDLYGVDASVIPSGYWYHISDGHVSLVTETSVKRAQAYMLFYERIV